MEINKIKELNERILNRATANVEKALIMDNWDCECFETMSEAIKNIYKLEKMEKGEIKYEEKVQEDGAAFYRMKENDKKSDFERCIYEIIEKRGMEKSMKAILKVLNELMEEDLRVIHTRMYDNTMRKLRELK